MKISLRMPLMILSPSFPTSDDMMMWELRGTLGELRRAQGVSLGSSRGPWGSSGKCWRTSWDLWRSAGEVRGFTGSAGVAQGSAGGALGRSEGALGLGWWEALNVL